MKTQRITSTVQKISIVDLHLYASTPLHLYTSTALHLVEV